MKKIYILTAVVLVSSALAVGIVNAKEVDVTIKRLGGKVGDVFKIAGTVMANALKVKGAAHFEGKISNPKGDVTISDNLRVDGRVYRGTKAGAADSRPFSVNDNMEVVGSLAIGSLATNGVVKTDNLADGAITAAKISDGTVATTDLASQAVTQGVEDENTTVTTTKFGTDYDTAAEIQITTGASTLFCQFSGYGATDTPNHKIAIALILDGAVLLPTYRSATMGDGDGHSILATSDLMNVTAGAHTVRVGWNTSHAGITASMFYNTLDCIELKR